MPLKINVEPKDKTENRVTFNYIKTYPGVYKPVCDNVEHRLVSFSYTVLDVIIDSNLVFLAKDIDWNHMYFVKTNEKITLEIS